MRWFCDLKTRTKLLGAFGVVSLLVMAVAAVGYSGLRAVNDALVAMHDEHFAVAISLTETSARLNAVRATLLGMMAAKDRPAQEKAHARIKELTGEIDAAFKTLTSGSLGADLTARVQKVQEPWIAFRDTRDRELIPLIYDGKLDEARD